MTVLKITVRTCDNGFQRGWASLEFDNMFTAKHIRIFDDRKRGLVVVFPRFRLTSDDWAPPTKAMQDYFNELAALIARVFDDFRSGRSGPMATVYREDRAVPAAPELPPPPPKKTDFLGAWIGQLGIVKCPHCHEYFNVADKAAWDDPVHLICGGHIETRCGFKRFDWWARRIAAQRAELD